MSNPTINPNPPPSNASPSNASPSNASPSNASPSPPPPLIPGKPDPLPTQNNFDGYGCAAMAGFIWSPSDGMCCKQMDCKDPQPWVCNPSQLPSTDSMDWHGCKKPNQTYDSKTAQCCNAVCMLPQFNH